MSPNLLYNGSDLYHHNSEFEMQFLQRLNANETQKGLPQKT
jgi:hypothetical protein